MPMLRKAVNTGTIVRGGCRATRKPEGEVFQDGVGSAQSHATLWSQGNGPRKVAGLREEDEATNYKEENFHR